MGAEALASVLPEPPWRLQHQLVHCFLTFSHQSWEAPAFIFFTSKTIILSFLPSNQHLPSGSVSFSLLLTPFLSLPPSLSLTLFILFFSPPQVGIFFDWDHNRTGNASQRQQGEELPFAPQRCQIVYCLSFISLFLFVYWLLLFWHNMWRITNLNPASASLS